MPKTPEGVLKDEVVKYLKTLDNCHWYIPQDGCKRGVPDMLIAHNGRLSVIELKANPRNDYPVNPSELQKIELENWHRAGIQCGTLTKTLTGYTFVNPVSKSMYDCQTLKTMMKWLDIYD